MMMNFRENLNVQILLFSGHGEIKRGYLGEICRSITCFFELFR